MEKDLETKNLPDNKKGITLIALIITIIVLLILAGVSISLVMGDSGVFTQAKDASVKTTEADIEEALGRAIASAQGEYTTSSEFNSGRKTFYEWLKSDTGKLKENGYTIKLKDKNGELQGTIIKKDKANGLKFKLKGGEARLDVDVEITGEYNPTKKIPGAVMAEDLGAADIGKVVKYEGYEAEYNGDWEIFYVDDENIYLISRLVVKSGSLSNIYNDADYKGTDDFKDLNNLENFPAVKQGWLSKMYLNNEIKIQKTDDSMKAVEWLLDKRNWDNYRNSDVAEWVIGGPTYELFLKSFFKKRKGSIEGWDEKLVVTSESGYAYEPFLSSHSVDGAPLDNGSGYWISAPRGFMYGKLFVFTLNSIPVRGSTLSPGNISSVEGFRPVVCLNSEIQLVEENGIYKICD